MWPWQLAVLTAVILAVVGELIERRAGRRDDEGLEPPTSLAHRARRSAPAYLREAAVVLGLYALWQVVLDVLVVRTAGAVSRGLTLWDWERAWHLPSEAHFQQLALRTPDLVRAANVYYAIFDFPAVIAGLIWLFARHRERYRHYRLTLIAVTGFCAFIQTVPVAPPRLLPGRGIVDTGLRFGQSVYHPGAHDPAVLTTMPSVHVAWAAVVAMMVIGSSASRWRWWILAHPILTFLVVVVTGNHFWADGLVALGLLAAVLAAQRWSRWLVHPGRGEPRLSMPVGLTPRSGGYDALTMQDSRFPRGSSG